MALLCALALGMLLAPPASAAKRANLKVKAISPPPGSVVVGAGFAATDTTVNAGKKTAPASSTRFYLSLDGVRDPGDVRLGGTHAVPKLRPRKQSTKTTQVTVPAATVTGDYRLIGCADDTRAVRESRESDNCRATDTTVAVEPVPVLPTTPYAINQGLVGTGTSVSLSNVTVTASSPSGATIWVGVQSGDPGFDGVEYSALEVQLSPLQPAVQGGDRVNLTGTVQTPGPGAPWLIDASVVQTGISAVDPPLVLTPSTILANPAALNAVLVEAQNVTLGSHAGNGDWVMQEGFGVGDGLIGSLPPLSDGAPVTSVAGIADTTGGTMLISPRSGADIDAPVSLLAMDFAPNVDDCRYGVGSTGVPLGSVYLSEAAEGDTFIAVGSSATGVATVNAGGPTLSFGQSSAQILGDLIGPGTVTLTATLAPIEKTMQLEVRADSDPVALTGLSLSAPTVNVGQSVTATVTLDCESPTGGTEVTLSSDSADAGVPASVTVPAGQSTAAFLVQGVSSGSATITATFNAHSEQANLTVN